MHDSARSSVPSLARSRDKFAADNKEAWQAPQQEALAKQRKKRRIEAGTSETVGETVEPMDEGDEGDDGGGSDVAVDDDGDDGDDGGDEEALLDAAQLSPERLAYTESEYGLPGTGSQEERAEAAVEALRAQSAKLRKKKNGKISKDAKDRRNMQNAWRRVDSYQTEGGK